MTRSVTALLALLLAAGSVSGQAPVAAPAAPAAPAPAPRIERGFGPVTFVTDRGPLTVRLLRRDKDLVWVDRLTSAGTFVETGVAVADIRKLEMPRPRVMDTIDQATTPEQVAATQAALKRISDALRPYRDLPGAPADEALFLQARLAERVADWNAALAIYNDLAKQPHNPKEAEPAKLRAALCLVKMQRHDDVLATLDAMTIPDDDLDLLSDLYYARAQARAAKGRHDEAILDYLYLVVFHPFVANNEPRCLASVLPSYAAMEEWDAMWKTMTLLRTQYAGSPEAARAEEFVKQYAAQLEAEAAYQEPQAPNEEKTTP